MTEGARAYEHVDDFIDDPSSDDYAAFVLSYFRMPAGNASRFRKFMSRHRLFCTYRNVRYRVTGCSRLGDVWIARNYDQHVGYDFRVHINDCSAWKDRP